MKFSTFSVSRLSAALLLAGVLGACGNKDPQQLVSSARDYLQKNDNAAAIIELKNALQEKPDLAEARFLLGKALLLNGDPVNAQTELQKARDMGYSVDEVVPLLVRSQLQQGKYRDVTEAHAKTVLVSPQAKAALLTGLAVAWRQQGELPAADAALADALRADPDHAPALVEQARGLAAQRNFDGALAVLASLLEKSPKEADALKLRGDIQLFGKNDKAQALQAYQAAVQARPKFAEAQAGVVRTHLSQDQLDLANKALDDLAQFAGGHPTTLYLQGMLAFQKGDIKLAQERAQQLLKRSPDSPIALELAGAIELQLKSPVKAQALLGQALQAAPGLRIARRALVVTYLQTGQIDQALATLPDDIATNDSDPSMLTVAGQAYMVKGDAAQAQKFFTRAARLDPNDPKKRTALAVSQFASGQTELALSSLGDIASTDSGASADLALINAHMQRRELDMALEAIDRLAKKSDKDALPLQLRGRALLMKNDRAGARQAFEKALERDPSYMAATDALAALDLADKKPQDAKKRYEAQTARNPQNAHAFMGLAGVLAASGGDKQAVADVLQKAVDAAPTEKAPRLMLVEHLLRSKDAKGALAAAQSAIAVQPDVPDLLDALGRAQTGNGEYNQALASFNKLANLLPKSPLPELRMASVHLQDKNTEAASKSLRKALDIQPDLLMAQRGLVELAMQSKQPSEALAVSRKIKEQRPKEAAGYILEGDVQALSKNWKAAAEVYRAGLKVVASSELAVKLYSVLVQGGSAAEADRFAAEWLKANPKDLMLTMHLADRTLSTNKLQEAQRHYERAIALQPKNALALNNLAWIIGQQGQGAAAIALAERANEAAPNQPAFMDTLAMLLSEQGEHAKAIALQNQVIGLKPDTPVFKLNLAKMLIKSGDNASASKLLDELAAKGEKFAGQAEVQSLKQGLK